MTGCIDSDPLKTTTNCLSGGGQTLTLHGVGFSHLCANPPAREGNERSQFQVDAYSCSEHIKNSYCVLIGQNSCTALSLSNVFSLTCAMSAGQGENLSVKLVKRTSGGCEPKHTVAEIPAAVSYKQVINFRQMFNQLVEYGVGGLKKEIDQLYRRAFASRGESVH